MAFQQILKVVIIIVLLLLSAFFSSAETALTTVNRIRIQVLAENGDRRAAITKRVISDPGKMLSAILIGNNLVNMAVSAILTSLVIEVFGSTFQ